MYSRWKSFLFRGDKIIAEENMVMQPYTQEDKIRYIRTSTTRVRHYTNAKGLKGIKESGTIIAQDIVYLEMANKNLRVVEKQKNFIK